MLAIVYSCALVGIDGEIIEVQVDYNNAGLPAFTVVGLPGKAVQESRERVRSAIRNSKLIFLNKQYVVNLAPADLPKEGPAYDLPIAIGVLAATDQIPLDTEAKSIFIGELGLDGQVKHVRGILPMVLCAQEAGFEQVFVAEEDAPQASLVPNIDIIPVSTLGTLVEHLYGLNVIPPYQRRDPFLYADEGESLVYVDFKDIKGQEAAKRALEVAAAGGHNALMTGSPGVGKTLMARALPGILPRMDLAEALEVTRIYSVADLLAPDQPLLLKRPFRAPHHTISEAGLIGGGSYPRPGEVSLAHRGVLFLDEFPEFGGHTLEVLRQPIEDKQVTISRAKQSLTFPSNFMLVAAMNPCPCGYYGDSVQMCTCSLRQIQKYQQRVSGPLLDRIDIHIEVPRVDYDKLTDERMGEPSAVIRARVEAARALQRERFKEYPHLHANADMGASDISKFCVATPEATKLLDATIRRLHLSARAYHRIRKLARTIADLAGHEYIELNDMAEAIQYRPRRLSVS
ncbi:MAG: magnesium chelatase [Phototrophicales bacterium]|nr:MAG: magnesium chelatase [Phototrophicales bacterium]